MSANMTIKEQLEFAEEHNPYIRDYLNAGGTADGAKKLAALVVLDAESLQVDVYRN